MLRDAHITQKTAAQGFAAHLMRDEAGKYWYQVLNVVGFQCGEPEGPFPTAKAAISSAEKWLPVK